jgi:tryptophan halogenase
MSAKRNIYILGNDVIGAMAAAYFAKKLPENSFSVIYIEGSVKGNAEAIYSTTNADLRKFMLGLECQEAQFLIQTDAVFSLGDRHGGVAKQDYVNTYCPYGLSLEGVNFLSVMQKAGMTKSLKSWEAYNLPASMIRQGKFNPPDSKGRPIISDFSYGYQVNVKLFQKLLREIALKEGARLLDMRDVKQYYFEEDLGGTIEFTSGDVIHPDLIIDACSGGCFPYKDEQWLPTQALGRIFMDVEANQVSQFANHVHHDVLENVIKTNISLQSETLCLSINEQGKGQAYKLGCVQKPWLGNVVRLGQSYGLLPLMGAPLRINQIAIERLLSLFPASEDMESERREYNKLMRRAFNRFEDFQSLWLSTSGFKLKEAIELSEDARYRQRLFEARGRLPNFDDDLLLQDQWQSMFLGQGVWPQSYNHLAGNISDDVFQEFSDNYVSVVTSVVSQMPDTVKFIEKHVSANVAYGKNEKQSNKNEKEKTKSMTSNEPIKSVVIAGGGTAGWMVAAALARTLGDSGISITLVESDAIGTVGVGEATIPNIASFNNILGIDEATFMKATQATIKYGIEFVGWTQDGDSYFHPFGQHGHAMAGLSFHHLWQKLHSQGKADRIEAYCATAIAAKHGKATLPARDPKSILSSLSHAYQFDAGRYAAFLRKYAEKLGVKRIEGKITDIDLGVESGFIESLILENKQTVKADFFIDCTGFRALLAEKALGVGYQDWSHWLPCDSAQAVSCQKTSDALPYTRATARKAGWQWRIPLQHRTGNGYVYASDYTTDEEVSKTLLGGLDGEPIGSPKQLRFKTGVREKLWHKNCVAIGLSGGFLEPLESTSIYLIQAGISRLLALFPDQGFNEFETAEYNKIMALEFEQVRDFLILHYVANERHGEPFWDYVRNMSIPDGLQQKIELFKHRGRFFRYDGDLFTETSWVAVFLGQNIRPKAYSQLVDGLAEPQIERAIASIKSEIAASVSRMPSHEEFLARYCPAPEFK